MLLAWEDKGANNTIVLSVNWSLFFLFKLWNLSHWYLLWPQEFVAHRLLFSLCWYWWHLSPPLISPISRTDIIPPACLPDAYRELSATEKCLLLLQHDFTEGKVFNFSKLFPNLSFSCICQILRLIPGSEPMTLSLLVRTCLERWFLPCWPTLCHGIELLERLGPFTEPCFKHVCARGRKVIG